MIVRCENCNKDFDKKISEIKRTNHNFCSRKCKNEAERLNLIGQRFGNLDVLEFDCVKNKNRRFKCQCVCGQIISVSLRELRSGQKSCRKCSNRKKYVGKISSAYFSRIKANAAQRGMIFNITKEYLWDLYQKQNGKCAYSGLDIDFADTYYEYQNCFTTASLDRIDNLCGYTQCNVHWIHKFINLIKQDFSEDVFFYYIKNIVEFDRKFTKIENYKLSKKDTRFKGFGEISGAYWCDVKKGARKRNISFNLNIEDVWQKYLYQGGVCYWSGLPIQFYPKINKKEDRILQTASIDRVDSSKGYQIDNIVVSHKQINNMKLDFASEEFIYYCQKIYDNCNLKKLK